MTGLILYTLGKKLPEFIFLGEVAQAEKINSFTRFEKSDMTDKVGLLRTGSQGNGDSQVAPFPFESRVQEDQQTWSRGTWQQWNHGHSFSSRSKGAEQESWKEGFDPSPVEVGG